MKDLDSLCLGMNNVIFVEIITDIAYNVSVFACFFVIIKQL